ncbi:hypothetical protein TEA_007143 [Camellia sinensis var. sinensis]|uniref:NAC domain-containing protein n=1 Tax=Camellia sinensis var. sinensis TaxID=542762 RepID=A0A4S4DGZ6_CAMSN|nr:hypothetical protein TEA_007143 [Camellia sinensis var. sinensis]
MNFSGFQDIQNCWNYSKFIGNLEPVGHIRTGVSKDGLIRHFFHRPSKAYTTGTRKRRKVHTDIDGNETRWHKTGKTRPVFINGKVKGHKKILVLYTNYGKQRKPEKTNWVMHQYHLGNNEDERDGELVVSKVFYQTQPRQCGSIMKEPSPSKSKGLKFKEHNNIVEYYNPTLISFDQGVSKDGLIRHFFHRPSKAYTTGTRKRRKVHTDIDGNETRWHKTGKTRPVFINGKVKGHKKILVLYTNYGKQRKPEKTNWVMHQYHLGNNEDERDGELVVSKVFYQTQPRQCGSIMKEPSPSKSKGLKFKEHNNIVEYYNPTLISFDQGGHCDPASPPPVIPNFNVHVGSSIVS